MDIVGFIKSILIDSLAGISSDNLLFILVQLLSALLAIFYLNKILLQVEDKKQLLYMIVFFTITIIIAKTSVPLAFILSAIIIFYLIKDEKSNLNTNLSLLFVSFSAGSGHLVLLFLGLIFIFIYTKIAERSAE